MDINSAAGTKVVFIGKNGYESELKKAMTHLTVGEELTVQRIEVSQSSSTVIFEEAPGLRFNTCMFKNNSRTWERFHWFAHCYMGITELTQEDFADMPFNQDDMSDDVLFQIVGEAMEKTLAEIPQTTAAIEIKGTVQNKLVTASRYNDEQLSVLNPKDEQEVMIAFMDKYGYQPHTFRTIYFEHTFDPRDLLPQSCCDC